MPEPLVARNPLSRRLRLLDPLKGARDPALQASDSSAKSLPSSLRLHLHPRLQATGSLLPQPQTARVAPNEAAELEGSSDMATIHDIYPIILQSAVDTETCSAIERVLSAAKQIASCKSATLFLIEKDEKNNAMLRVKGRRGDNGLFPCQGLAGACINEKRAIISNRPHHDSRFDALVDWAPSPGVKTIACVPVYTILGKLVGVLQVANKVVGGFTSMDMTCLDLLGRQATVTLELCNKFERIDSQNRKLTTIINRFIELAKCSDLVELVHATGVVCKEVCDAEKANCFIIDNENMDLCTWSKSTESKTETFKESRIPLKGIFEQVLSSSTNFNSSLRIENASVSARQHLGSLYCPVSHHSRAVGFLQVRNCKHVKFTDNDRNNLELVGNMAGALHYNLMKMNPAASQELQSAWEDVDAAERSINSFVTAVAQCRHCFLLILDSESSLLWTKRLDSNGNYIYFEADSFPFSHTLQNQGSLNFPSETKDRLSEKQVLKLKTISKLLCPNETMEALMTIALQAYGKTVGVVLAIKCEEKHSRFDPWVLETVKIMSNSWGLKLQHILEKERASTTYDHFSAAISAIGDLYHMDHVLNCYFEIGKLAEKLFAFERCWFFRIQGNGTLSVKLHPDEEPKSVELSEAGIAGRAFESKTYQMSLNVHQDSRHSYYLSILTKFEVNNLICVPVFSVESESSMIGILQLMNKRGIGSKINQSDVTKVEQFSTLAATLVQNAMTRSELKAVRNRLDYQVDKQNFIVEQASKVHDLSQFDSLNLVNEIKAMIRSTFGPVECVLFMAGHGGSAMYELKDDVAALSYSEAASGIAGHVIKTGSLVFHTLDHSSEHFDPAVDQRSVRSASAILCAPLVHGQRQIGCIQVISRSADGERRIFLQDAQLLLQLGKHIACAILNNVLLSKVYASVNLTDPVNFESDLDQQLVKYGTIVRDIVKAERANVFVREGGMATAIDEFTGRRILLRSDQGTLAFSPPSTNAKLTFFKSKQQASLIIEILNKQSGAFDGTDEIVSKMIGKKISESLAYLNHQKQLNDARRQTLSMLMSSRFLYSSSGSIEVLLSSAISQISSVMSAKIRMYIAIFDENNLVTDSWRCFEHGGTSTIVPIAGIAGSCFRKVSPVIVQDSGLQDQCQGDQNALGSESSIVRDVGPACVYMCHPLMDNSLLRPIGVVEMRRNLETSSSKEFTKLEEDLAFHIATILVDSMVFHTK
ncbi:hypothetical protein GUITHDRAFT_100524 [Guillardia theta CCMP2712]|uniref:GAF domain-containing protein n=1 Tax=Guillardia theta (strain CCMP2712) TaxID=905079 RepID=L1JZJ6_GUITC|nr:hypothetical protein GUITHDRAFT_100524 [Guillardia theta CCMP2712]EKX53538.1 hypothetical protein GUITHDRAFT_100524 [Guillardia theta CCMP2712]|eukprot:XP_005840518.1 hypothetical protein GUITHDRAFT_100524 [Guillardia theta CCMP2712]